MIKTAIKYVAHEHDSKHSFIKTVGQPARHTFQITFTFAISFHSVLEGFALGVQVNEAPRGPVPGCSQGQIA